MARNAPPSPAESLPLELIYKIIYFLAEQRFLHPNDYTTYATITRDLSSSSRIARIWKEPSEQILDKQAKMSLRGIYYCSQYKPARCSSIANLSLELTRWGSRSSEIINLHQALTHFPTLTSLSISCDLEIFRVSIQAILIHQKNLDFLNLKIDLPAEYIFDPSADWRRPEYDGAEDLDFTISGITSLENLKELALNFRRLLKWERSSFFGQLKFSNLKKLTLSDASKFDCFKICPNLEELSIESFNPNVDYDNENDEGSNLIELLEDTSIEKLTLASEKHLVEQFEEYEPPRLAHLLITNPVDLTSEDFENLSFLPATIELHLSLRGKGLTLAAISALEGYEFEDINVRKLVFSHFGFGESEALKEAWWNEIIVECERLEVEVERE